MADDRRSSALAELLAKAGRQAPIVLAAVIGGLALGVWGEWWIRGGMSSSTTYARYGAVLFVGLSLALALQDARAQSRSPRHAGHWWRQDVVRERLIALVAMGGSFAIAVSPATGSLPREMPLIWALVFMVLPRPFTLGVMLFSLGVTAIVLVPLNGIASDWAVAGVVGGVVGVVVLRWDLRRAWGEMRAARQSCEEPQR